MNIAKIEGFVLKYSDPNDFGNERYTVLARVETAEGIVGWGEGIAMWPEACRATVVLIHEGFGPLLKKMADVDPEKAWHVMRRHSWWYGEGGIASFALSAIDIALWDIQGKAAGKPLFELFGGKKIDRLKACASLHVNKATLEECIEEVEGFVAAGFRSVKLGFAKKGLSRIGYDPDLDVQFVTALRARLGEAIEILVDAGNGVMWDVETAIRTILRMQQQNIGWIEEPFHPTDIASYSELRKHISVPIAAGEREWTVAGYQRLIETQTVDVLGIDPARAEGVTGFRKVDELAGRAQLKTNAHAWSTAITTAASLHLSLSSWNTGLFELKPLPVAVQQELVDRPVSQVNGWATIGNTPGLGIEVQENIVRKYTLM